jgi:hypothetical protein
MNNTKFINYLQSNEFLKLKFGFLVHVYYCDDCYESLFIHRIFFINKGDKINKINTRFITVPEDLEFFGDVYFRGTRI